MRRWSVSYHDDDPRPPWLAAVALVLVTVVALVVVVTR